MNKHFLEKNKVFLADDSELSENLLEAYLIRKGYSVFRFKTGIELLETLLRGASPNLLLIGVVLPGISGLELLARLAAAKIKVTSMVMGTSHYKGEMSKAYQYGAVDYITKPLDLGDVAARIKSSLENGLATNGHVGFA